MTVFELPKLTSCNCGNDLHWSDCDKTSSIVFTSKLSVGSQFANIIETTSLGRVSIQWYESVENRIAWHGTDGFGHSAKLDC